MPLNLLSPYGVASVIWTLWGLSWLAASLWKGREATRGPAGPTRGWLLIATAGFAGLFAQMPGRFLPAYTLPPPLAWGSVLLIAAGCAFAWWARLHLGALWSGGIVAREGHRIVDSGPYARVRHPIYTGLFAGALGLAAIKATPLALVGALLIIAGFTGKARVEERFLGEALGEAHYAAYRARVPMLIPRLRA